MEYIQPCTLPAWGGEGLREGSGRKGARVYEFACTKHHYFVHLAGSNSQTDMGSLYYKVLLLQQAGILNGLPFPSPPYTTPPQPTLHCPTLVAAIAGDAFTAGAECFGFAGRPCWHGHPFGVVQVNPLYPTCTFDIAAGGAGVWGRGLLRGEQQGGKSSILVSHEAVHRPGPRQGGAGGRVFIHCIT